MKRLLFVFPLLLILASCSSTFYCNKCLQFGGIKRDTITSVVSVPVPGHSIDTTLQYLDMSGFSASFGDAITHEDSLAWNSWEEPKEIVKEDAKAKLVIKYIPVEKKIYVKCDCKPDTVKVSVPTLIDTTIEPGVPEARVRLMLIGTAMAALLIGLTVGRITKR